MKIAKAVSNNTMLLKMSSCIIGFSCWYFLSNNQHITVQHTVPLSFYGKTLQNRMFECADTITVRLNGKKQNFYSLDFNELTCLINIDDLHEGKNLIKLNSENLFLPPNIKLLNYTPSNIVVIIKKI